MWWRKSQKFTRSNGVIDEELDHTKELNMNHQPPPNKSLLLPRITAISGSLRAISSNTALLRAASGLASEKVKIMLYEDLAELPHFNPDLEGAEPLSVTDFRTLLRSSDAVLISSPEYAHGVPGALRNALDWLVSGGELVGKPVALINTSPRSTHAQQQLAEILATMAARVIPEASVAVPLAGRRLDEAGMIADAEVSNALRASLDALRRAIENSRVGDV